MIQSTLTNYPQGAAWADSHPRAVAYIVQRARCDNARGQAARLKTYIEEMRLTPQDFDLTARGRTYGFDHRDQTEVTRHIAESYGLWFAMRKAACDRQGGHGTPVVGGMR